MASSGADRWRVAFVGVTALVASALAACDGGGSDRAAPGAAASAPASAKACPAPESTGGPPATPRRAPDGVPAPVAFGQTRSTVGTGFDLEITVFDYKQPAGSACPDPERPGHEWAAVEVQTCPRALPGGLEYVAGWSVWSVAFTDGTTAGISTFSFPGFEEPRYPDGTAVPAGTCVRGWVSLPVPKGRRPATVLYRPVGEVHAWTVPPPS